MSLIAKLRMEAIEALTNKDFMVDSEGKCHNCALPSHKCNCVAGTAREEVEKLSREKAELVMDKHDLMLEQVKHSIELDGVVMALTINDYFLRRLHRQTMSSYDSMMLQKFMSDEATDADVAELMSMIEGRELQ